MATTLTDLVNIIFSTTGLMLAVIGLFFTLSFKHLNKYARTYFIVFFSLLIVYITSNIVFLVSLTYLDEEYTYWSKLTMFLESLFSSALMPLLSLSILHLAGVYYKKSKLFITELALWFVYIVLLVITQFTTFIYYFSPDNEYHRGPYYQLLLIPPVLMMSINLILLFIYFTSIPRRQAIYLGLYTIIPLISILLQMIFYGLQFIVIGTAIASIILFRSVIAEQIDLYIAQEAALNKQKTDIMLLQMRPHFIYNTMSSIYYLCELDPKKAQTLVGDFTTYLRKNMNALSSQKLIPFKEELEHTRAYLAVEKARYEKLLFVEYETDYIDFTLPSLTLQPIVENSIKHGLDHDLPPLHILIRTYKDGDDAVIEVEDTGPGYEPPQDNEVHIGIENVKERLHLMCDGTMDIETPEKGGTIVTLRISQ